MKQLMTILLSVALLAPSWAQVPEKLSYQAVIRNGSDELLTNEQIGMQISILQGSVSGTEVYTETQSPSTNANGLVTLEIGTGTTTDDFSDIDWSNGPYFIKTETDPTGGTDYTITGTTQLLSVPYAMHAKTADSITEGITETDPVFSAWDKTSGISIMESQILDFGNYLESETDPLYNSSVASDISYSDINYWDNKLDNESDPVFSSWDKSTGISITEDQISDLGSYIETESDPVFESSPASGITTFDITSWDNKLDMESDPVYSSWDKSTGILISESQISDLGNYIETESDPDFNASVAAGINGSDTSYWNNKLDSYTETDPVFSGWDKSTGISITEDQISDFGSYLETESDPDFNASVAAGINGSDTSYWNNKIDNETQNLTDVLNQSNDGGGIQIKNIADPADDQDAVTKKYVDALENRIFELEYNAGKDTVVDCDGNVYNIIKIGDQYWLDENLKTTKFNDCTDIPLETDNTAWGNLNTPGYCWYDNDSTGYAATYGAMYNWHAVETGNLCPEGFRVPTDEDWKGLEMAVGMSEAVTDSTDFRGTNEGSKLAGNAALWVNHSLTSDGDFASSGLSIVPGGDRDNFGVFASINHLATLWSATEASSDFAKIRAIQYDRKTVFRGDYDKKFGLSVRCVRN